jgi:putative PEP-CTERM system TPR-repeat lipoprotein
VQLQLAQAEHAAGNLKQARDAINSVLSMQPRHLEAERALFLLDAENRGYEEAKKTAQRIQQNHPKSPTGFMLQGDVEMVLKQFGEAIKSYEAAAALDKNKQLVVRLHQAYMAAGQRAQAEAKTSAWLKQFPNDLDIRFYLAQVYMGMGQDKQATEQYEFLVKAQPRNAIAWNNLAWLYLKANDSRALRAAEQAYKIRPDEVGVTDTYGWMLVQQGDLARGVPLLEKAHTRAKNSPEIQYHYAAALMKAGNKAKAKPLLEQLVKGKPFPQLEDAKRLLAQL